MTTVIEGKMEIQFFIGEGDDRQPDGAPITLETGQTGFIRGGRVHSAKYLEDCKLVYVHSGPFGVEEKEEGEPTVHQRFYSYAPNLPNTDSRATLQANCWRAAVSKSVKSVGQA